MLKLLSLSMIGMVSAQWQSCSPSCKGTTTDGTPFDLSALMGADYQTSGSDQHADTFYLNVCGTVKQECPDDLSNVTMGMAVHTVESGGCYVLGQYTGENCLWKADPGGQKGVELVLDNGSASLCGDGEPRQVTVAFVCPAAGSKGQLVPDSWSGVNLPGSCEYTYTFETCAACDGGCADPPPPPPTGQSCSATCTGTTSDGTHFDLSALMGVDYQTSGLDQHGDIFYLNVCGTSKTKCPDDAGDPAVTEGMAVHTVDLGGCYVLGQYTDDNCRWTADPGGNEGVELVLDNGSNDLCGDGGPRQVTVDFLCPAAGSKGQLVPDSWSGVNLPGTCEYTYTFETCAACDGGCAAPPPPPPHPTPCCEPKYFKYATLCHPITDKVACTDENEGFGDTCTWTCAEKGECDANKPQFQSFCSTHTTESDCDSVSQTCTWNDGKQIKTSLRK